MAQFVGQRISLISRSDVRYLGTLDEVNEESSTVTLKDVKSFGTEGRRGIPTEEIPANDTVYPYISFKGSDVKDLRIHKDDEHAGDQPSVGGGSIQSDVSPPSFLQQAIVADFLDDEISRM